MKGIDLSYEERRQIVYNLVKDINNKAAFNIYFYESVVAGLKIKEMKIQEKKTQKIANIYL